MWDQIFFANREKTTGTEVQPIFLSFSVDVKNEEEVGEVALNTSPAASKHPVLSCSAALGRARKGKISFLS